MRLGNEAKVGLIVFAAFVGLVAVYWFLGGFGLRASTYPIHAIFGNVQKLDKGADVRLAGVKIGLVSSVTLTPDNQARVDMLVDNDNAIPKDSKARITTGAVIGDSFVEIVPGSSKTCVVPNGYIGSMQVLQFDQIMSDAGALVQELRVSAKSMNQLLGDKELIGSFKDTVKGLQQSADSASELLATAKGMLINTSPQVDRVFDNLAVATQNAIRVSEDIETIINKDARGHINEILTQAAEATKGLNESIGQAKELIGNFNSHSGRLVQTMDKVDATVCQAEQMMANLNQASASVKELATDEELKNNIRTTMRNAAQASEEAKTLVGGLTRKFTGVQTGPTPQQKAAIPDYGVSGDALWNTGTGDPRFDVNYTFAGEQDAFYRLGLFDLGNSTKVNLMGGIAMDRSNAFRYGLYASRLGVGYDRRFTDYFRVSADMYRPDDLQLELRGIFNWGNGFGLYTGVANLFGGSNKDVLLGVHYNK